MKLDLESRCALVLGSSSGLGKAIAESLIRENAKVALSGRDPDRLQAALHETGAAAAVLGDLRERGDADRMVTEAAKLLGGLDIIVINTGGGGAGMLGTTTHESRDSAYHSLLRPALDVAVAAIPYLKNSIAGRMLFITARSVVEASTDLALSSVFRSGVAAAARSLAVELAPKILVNVIVPGQFDTPAYRSFRSWLAGRDGVNEDEISQRHLSDIPLARLGQADELANVVTFLCSDRASYVTGTVVRIDGGGVKGFH